MPRAAKGLLVPLTKHPGYRDGLQQFAAVATGRRRQKEAHSGPSGGVDGHWPARTVTDGARHCYAHDVSIRISGGCGDGRCLGVLPGANTSMMIMRPPQNGHGRGELQGGLGSASARVSWVSVSGFFCAV